MDERYARMFLKTGPEPGLGQFGGTGHDRGPNHRLCLVCRWPGHRREMLEEALRAGIEAAPDGIPDIDAIAAAYEAHGHAVGSHLSVCMGRHEIAVAAERKRGATLAAMADEMVAGIGTALDKAEKMLWELEETHGNSIGLAKAWTDAAKTRSAFMSALVDAMKDGALRERMALLEARIAALTQAQEAKRTMRVVSGADAAGKTVDLSEVIRRRRKLREEGEIVDVDPLD